MRATIVVVVRAEGGLGLRERRDATRRKVVEVVASPGLGRVDVDRALIVLLRPEEDRAGGESLSCADGSEIGSVDGEGGGKLARSGEGVAALEGLVDIGEGRLVLEICHGPAQVRGVGKKLLW